MPAAAVIPAPIAYIKVVAVKKLVVELQTWPGGPLFGVLLSGRALPLGEPACPTRPVKGMQAHQEVRPGQTVTRRKADRPARSEVQLRAF